MLLTEAQLREVAEIIANHHSAFVVNTIGPNVVSPEVLDKLRRMGLVNVKPSSIEDAYLYGMVTSAADATANSNMSYGEFKQYLKRNPVPLTQVERQAVAMAQQRAANYITGLGNKINTQTGALMIEADAQQRQAIRATIRSKVEANIVARQTAKQLKSDIGHATGEWARDLDRIANTEKQSAMAQGRTDAISAHSGPDALVAKQTASSCCPHCARLYNGTDGKPRIFRMADLIANGTNVGRKVGEWRPVIGPTHPNCACVVIEVPAGWGFDENGDLSPDGKFGERVKGDALVASMRPGGSLRKGQSEGPTQYAGLPIYVETPAGGVRHWEDRTGRQGATTMAYSYGYIEGSHGMDNEPIDCYLGPDPDAGHVYIVHQAGPDGRYDEQKVMLGFDSEAAAREAYALHRDDGHSRIAGVDQLRLSAFKRFLALPATVPQAPPAPESLTRSERRGPRLVLSHQGRLSKASAASLGGPVAAADRNPSSGGVTGAALLFNPPPFEPPARSAKGSPSAMRDLIDNIEAPQGSAVQRDPAIYELPKEGAMRRVRSVEPPQAFGLDPVQRKDDIKRRRAYLDAQARAGDGLTPKLLRPRLRARLGQRRKAR